MANRDFKFFCQAERGADGNPAVRWAYKSAREVAAFKNWSIWEMLAADRAETVVRDGAGPDGYVVPDSASVWKPGKMRATTVCAIRDAIENGECLVPVHVAKAPKAPKA